MKTEKRQNQLFGNENFKTNKMASTLSKSWRLPLTLRNSKYLSSSLHTSSKTCDEKVTHTGQKFEEKDRRLVRFMGKKEKQVNPHFAIDLINAVPPKPVKESVVCCDGGGGALGHPKVYINLDKPGPKACGYCGLRFVLEHHH